MILTSDWIKIKAENWYIDYSHKYKINQGVIIGGRWPSVEDDLWWKTTFGRRQPLVEKYLRWKMTFCGRRPFVGRQPSVDDDLSGRTILALFLVGFAALFIKGGLSCSAQKVCLAKTDRSTHITNNEKVIYFFWFEVSWLVCLYPKSSSDWKNSL